MHSFFTFFKGWRCNKSSVVTPKKISHGSLRKWMSNFTRIVITHLKFWKFHVQDVFPWNLTFIFSGSHFFWCHYRWFIISSALEKYKKECNMLWIIMVQGFLSSENQNYSISWWILNIFSTFTLYLFSWLNCSIVIADC